MNLHVAIILIFRWTHNCIDLSLHWSVLEYDELKRLKTYHSGAFKHVQRVKSTLFHSQSVMPWPKCTACHHHCTHLAVYYWPFRLLDYEKAPPVVLTIFGSFLFNQWNRTKRSLVSASVLLAILKNGILGYACVVSFSPTSPCFFF